MALLKRAGQPLPAAGQAVTAAPATEHVRPYLRIPEKLLRMCVYDPVAVGIYLFVARCALAERDSAPLSANDIAAWSGHSHSRVAIMRRIRRLLSDGWLIAAREQTVKLRLLPTWDGRCSWLLNDPRLGKPADVRTRRVPLDVLDSYMGRCDPQPGRRPALITRYFDQPLLDLADLGIYAIAAIATIEPTERLRQLGLLHDGEPQAPQLLDNLLARAADGSLKLSENEVVDLIRPSSFGWRRLRRVSDDPDDPSSGELIHRSGSPSGSASGSLSRSPSGSRSGSLSGSHKLSSGTIVYELPERAKLCLREATASYAWDSWNPSMEGMNPPPMSREQGGGSSAHHNQQDRASATAINPEIEAMLRAMGVRNSAALAGVPAELIAQWQAVVNHPGMQARFTDPVAFAITQMKRGAAPPSADELEHWTQSKQQRDDQHQSWRYIPPVEAAPDDERHAQLAERARALALPDATALDVLDLFTFLAEGASEAEALERLTAKQVASEAQKSDEEVYRALIARSTRC